MPPSGVVGSGAGDRYAPPAVPRSQPQAAETVSADDVVRLRAIGLERCNRWTARQRSFVCRYAVRCV